ncbi:glycosyl hydrolase [Xylaria venustula]|nr:glycosyl hydrolase [Xylaria venustula]
MRLFDLVLEPNMLTAIVPSALPSTNARNSTYYNPVLSEPRKPATGPRRKFTSAGRWDYIITSASVTSVLFESTDPFDEAAWSDPVTFLPISYNSVLFLDNDGKAYMATVGVALQEINLTTGELSQPPVSTWNGTGGVSPEGPHLTDEYFHTVGYGDVFQDKAREWWEMCLATRSGPAWEIYPLGRESVLFPVTWDEGDIRGNMSGWAMPPSNRDLPGKTLPTLTTRL